MGVPVELDTRELLVDEAILPEQLVTPWSLLGG